MSVDMAQAKLKELVLYIAELEEDDPRFGAIKLNKILFYSDMGAYLRLGRSISGAGYQHLNEGPAPRELLPVRNELLASQEITLEDHMYFNRPQQRIRPRRGANLSIFTEDELEIVREVVEGLWNMNATEVTQKSHQEWGWRLTEQGEDIPYMTAFLSAEPLTEEQIEAGQRFWRERLEAE